MPYPSVGELKYSRVFKAVDKDSYVTLMHEFCRQGRESQCILRLLRVHCNFCALEERLCMEKCTTVEPYVRKGCTFGAHI